MTVDVFQYFKKFPQLTRLDISNSEIRVTDDSLMQLGEMCPQLEWLDLTDCCGDMTDQAMDAFVKACPSLVFLTLNENFQNIKEVLEQRYADRNLKINIQRKGQSLLSFLKINGKRNIL